MYKKIRIVLRIAISTVLLNVISSIVYSWVEDVDVITSFFKITEVVFNLIIDILTYDIPLWGWVSMTLFFVIVLYLHQKNQNIQYASTEKSKQGTNPSFLTFTTGIYKDIHYKWKIDKHYEDEYYIYDFKPVCKCGAELTTKLKHRNEYYSRGKLFCVNCDTIIEPQFDEEILRDAKLYFENILRNKVELHNNDAHGKLFS